MNFDAERKGTGTEEWAEETVNICRGCRNNCLYCYAAHSANRFKQRPRADWEREELTKRANITSYRARNGVIMFPSSHDITPFNQEAYIRVAATNLKKGNRLLIVSKPRIECITAIIEELAAFIKQILFRFTIGSMDAATCSFWEPGAPGPNERVLCLEKAFESGFSTSVSIEPMLGGVDSACRVVDAVHHVVTDTIWIGKMNKPRLRVDMSKPENVAAVGEIERMQCDSEIIRLYQHFNKGAKIRWKDSIKGVVAKATKGAGCD